jgi:amino acid adenylation domain-containing protein
MGAQPNRLIAIVMEKSWEQVVAAAAVLEAGAAYLPVDPDLPRERRWLLLDRGEVEIVLTQSCLADQLEWPAGIQCLPVDGERQVPEEGDDEPLVPAACSEDLAYVIFTSGSTGEPKGVMIEHGAALNTVIDINERFKVGPHDRILALSSLSFDLSVYDVFGALAAGATIVMPHPTSAREPADWVSLLMREQVTIWNSVPALLEMLTDHVGETSMLHGSPLRMALLSGDWIPLKLADRTRALIPDIEVVSLGGATEASIWSIFHRIGNVERDWSSIPYGRPLLNQQMRVLNDAMEPCPVWVPGQLYIGGVGLARGYWRDDVRTQAQFVHDPRTGERLYRTGDIGRFLPDGTIEFMGREDDQVKVQGYRIELGEIESTLERHPKVKSAAVVAVGDRAAPKHLAAYVVADAGADELAVDELSEYLRQTLPSYMVPTVWRTLEALPLTSNGKVNRKALPAVATRSGGAPREARKDNDQSTHTLGRVTAMISEELALPALDPHQNLLTVGATSLDLVRIVARLEKEFGVRPSFQEFFAAPTASALADLIQKGGSVPDARNGVLTGSAAAPRRSPDLIIDPAAREAFRRAKHGTRAFATDWGILRLERERPPAEMEAGFGQRRAIRNFRAEPVPLSTIGVWLAELSRANTGNTDKYTYGSAGSCYPVQTYLHAKKEGIAGCPAGTFYYHPVEHGLVPLTLGVELDPSIHEPLTNRPIFEQARFSVFFVNQPRAIEPMYGDLSWRFSVLEAGAMAHVLESSAARFGLGVCPIGMLDFGAVRPLLHLDNEQELLHAHVGGLAEISPASEFWEEGII